MENAKEIELRLVNAVTNYDRKESKKKYHNHYYNHYALPQYLQGVNGVIEYLNNGMELRKAIKQCFIGRLADDCLKAVESQA